MLPLRHPFMDIVAGPTSCGKTRFVFRLIDNVVRMIDPPPRKVVYCYREYQQLENDNDMHVVGTPTRCQLCRPERASTLTIRRS